MQRVMYAQIDLGAVIREIVFVKLYLFVDKLKLLVITDG